MMQERNKKNQSGFNNQNKDKAYNSSISFLLKSGRIFNDISSLKLDKKNDATGDLTLAYSFFNLCEIPLKPLILLLAFVPFVHDPRQICDSHYRAAIK